MHYEVLVEEPSAEAFLREALPNFIAEEDTFEIYSFQGKSDLLSKLPARLNGYSKWIPDDYRIIIALDRDSDNCYDVKQTVANAATAADLKLKTDHPNDWDVAVRVICEELEAWYFGDWDAVRSAYPRVTNNVTSRAAYRDPDAIAGGTWEAFERLLKGAKYFKQGLRKIEVARAIGEHFSSARCSSKSWQVFREAFN